MRLYDITLINGYFFFIFLIMCYNVINTLYTMSDTSTQQGADKAYMYCAWHLRLVYIYTYILTAILTH